jgi:integrase
VLIVRPIIVNDKMLLDWFKTLKPQTARVYRHSILQLLDKMKLDAKTLYERAAKDPVATWKEIKNAAKSIDSPHVRVLAQYAARRFLLDQDEDLMLPRSHLKQPELVKPPAYLSWDEAQKVCDAASSPYNLIFRIMLHSGWGLGEFLQFNKQQTWNAVKAKLAVPTQDQPYFRFAFRGRKKNHRPFYSLIPLKVLADAVALEAKGKIVLPISHRGRNGNTLVPLDDSRIVTNRGYLASAFKTALGRAAVVLTQGSPTPHELRDTFLTRAIQTGCSDSAANFVMGHAIDKLGYNKCDRDENWLWSELSKIHGPAAVTEDALASRDQQIEALREELGKRDVGDKKILELVNSAKEQIGQLKADVKRLQEQGPKS